MALGKNSTKQPFWAISAAEALEALSASSAGLSEKETEERIKIFGKNEIQGNGRLSKIKIILNQLKSPLILLLAAAGVITIFLGKLIETYVIFGAVAVNTALGFWQENKSEHVLALLKSFIRVRARVRRGNREKEIDSSELVPGDVIKISQGDRVPADGRIIFAKNFEVDESILTGEALPVEKNSETLHAGTMLAERTSMIFGGTLAIGGFADAVVSATGKSTEVGKIATLAKGKDGDTTPLQRAISRFSIKASLIIAMLAILLFGLGIYYGKDIFDMFIIAVSVAVSAVPEGLPVALTVILAIGVQRLSHKKGVVRKLLAAETLGSTTLVLTDKTGTLTEAKMNLLEADDSTIIEAIAGTDVVIENPDEPPEQWKMFGNYFEMALIKGSALRGILANELLGKMEILDRLPFNSERKFSGVIYKKDSKTKLVLLGAPDILLEFTDLSLEEKIIKLEEVGKKAQEGKRVLGVATKEVKNQNEHTFEEKNLKNLNFAGTLVFYDPLRKTAKDAVNKMKNLGVRTVILTGDHPGTAESVARELGLIDNVSAVISGQDLAFLSKDELKSRAKDIQVYARVTPEQKIMITKLYQELGETVAITGDGINDAPALKEADIGIAVGSGTDVAKNASDFVILNDDFQTIVSAIEEGRRILDNIKKVLVYLLSDTLDELFLIGGALVVGIASPLSAIQILFVNFFSDSFPAVAFAFEKSIDGPGNKPRKIGQNLFDAEMKFLIIAVGFTTSAILFVIYWILLRWGFEENLVRTFIFASFATYTLILSFSVRSLKKSIFHYNPFSNKYLVVGVGIGLLLTASVIYLPFLREPFQHTPLPFWWIMGVLGIGLLNISAIEITKWIFRNKEF